MNNFEHHSVTTNQEALDLMARDAGARIVAGGTDLLVLMKEGVEQPPTLIDIKQVRELAGVETSAGGLRLGALTTLTELEESADVHRDYTALAEAAKVAASPQLRNMATVGGNLLQRPRCWYFRSDFNCWLKGGDTCYAAQGENHHHAIFQAGPCVAVHPSDLAPALIALEASVEITGPGGERSVLVEDFLRDPTADRRIEHDLQPGELITAVVAPSGPEAARSTYLKAMERAAWAFALVSVAVRLTLEGGEVSDVRIVLGGVANTPQRAVEAERVLIGRQAGVEAFDLAAQSAVEGARALQHNGYKITLARNLVGRALTQAAG